MNPCHKTNAVEVQKQRPEELHAIYVGESEKKNHQAFPGQALKPVGRLYVEGFISALGLTPYLRAG